MRRLFGGALVGCAGALGSCCFAPAPHAQPPPPASADVTVPREVLAAHASELPLNLFVRTTPGTLLHRGFLLATLCESDAEVTTEWSAAVEGEVLLEAWVAPTYADNPLTPCGIVEPARRHDIIATSPTGRPGASARVGPGQHVTLVLTEPARPLP